MATLKDRISTWFRWYDQQPGGRRPTLFLGGLTTILFAPVPVQVWMLNKPEYKVWSLFLTCIVGLILCVIGLARVKYIEEQR